MKFTMDYLPKQFNYLDVLKGKSIKTLCTSLYAERPVPTSIYTAILFTVNYIKSQYPLAKSFP